MLTTIDLQQFVDPVLVRRRFWDMFVIDALLGNFDRHNGNWGFLVDEQTSVASLAPVFDCGSCLLPQADEAIMRKMLADDDELNARIYTFPGSMLKVSGRKINYHDFIAARSESGLEESLGRLLPRIHALDVEKLVAETPYLTDLQRRFLTVYLTARRERILLG